MSWTIDILPWGDDVGHYWKTSKKSASSWLDDAEKLIINAGGRVHSSTKYNESPESDLPATFVVAFQLEEQDYVISWPVLKHEDKDRLSAERQAATFIYHEVKAACVRAKVLGNRRAFAQFFHIGNGRNIQDLAAGQEIRLLGEGSSQKD